MHPPMLTQPPLGKSLLHATVISLIALLSWVPGAIAQMVYQYGSSGSEVEAIQAALGIPVDGVYGLETEAAVRQFQSFSGLYEDGIAGPETLTALGLGYLVDTSTVSYGAPSSFDFASSGYTAPLAVPPPPTVPNPTFVPFNSTVIASGQTSGPYVVAVPGRDTERLNRIRTLIPNAFVSRSGRGAYIQAGAFSQRSDASELSRTLRQNGFDARVIYDR